MSYPLPKDPRQAAYLQHLRDRNVRIASVCHLCKKQSTGINSDGYRIFFVCDEHMDEQVDAIVDTSNPGVFHVIYPNGKKIPKEALDPNIGNFFGPKDKNKKEEENGNSDSR